MPKRKAQERDDYEEEHASDHDEEDLNSDGGESEASEAPAAPPPKSKKAKKEEKTPTKKKDKEKKAPKEKGKETKQKATTGTTTNDSGEPVFDLGDKKRVTLRSFKGKMYIDIREFYEEKGTNQMKPGKKGISLNVEQWTTLRSIADSVDQAIETTPK